jgi:SAM-dependent methyltransferase
MTGPLRPPPSPPSPPPAVFAEALGEVLFPESAGLPSLPRATLARIVETYDTTLRRAGARPPGVLWYGRSSQRLRFRKLLGVLGDDRWRRRLVINDFGCGYGALFDLIRRRWFLRGGTYQGFDLCPRMVRQARLRVDDPRATFIEAAVPTLDADYTLCSGTFGLCLDTAEDDWRRYVQETLRVVADRSRRGFAFNLLDRRGGRPKADLYRADPDDYIDFCRRSFGPGVRLVDGYMDGDFTIWVRL